MIFQFTIYLHSTNQPSVLGLYPSNPNPGTTHSTNTAHHTPTSTTSHTHIHITHASSHTLIPEVTNRPSISTTEPHKDFLQFLLLNLPPLYLLYLLQIIIPFKPNPRVA